MLSQENTATLHVEEGQRILFGKDTLGNGDKFMFLPDLHAIRGGTVATGAASTYWNRDSIGLYSVSLGYNTRAQGFGATCFGRDTEATNSYAFASGFFSNADGQYSTAMGFNSDALAIGAFAAGYNADATGNYSVGIGHFVNANSFSSIAVGRYNIGGGNPSSWVGTDPIFEIGIGSSSSNKLNAMTVRKNGNVGLGTHTPGATLHVVGTVRIGSFEELSDGGEATLISNSRIIPLANGTRDLGSSSLRWRTIYTSNTVNVSSDKRLKKDIKQLDYGLKEIMNLKPVSYSLLLNQELGKKIGLIAQDVEKVIPEVVSNTHWTQDEISGELKESTSEFKGISYSELIPVLIKSIQDQQRIIFELTKRVEDLEAR